MKVSSILTHIYYRSINIYVINSFLSLYASLISVGWTNGEIRFLWYFVILDKICTQWAQVCNPLLLLYKILDFDFIEVNKLMSL